ncbi:hypothetical protein EKD04_012635 [Chloroflexales bacterium ZM16-3]|nr:hypothetical protein [Chloroflexales bacterium ZM16-3]
MHLLAVRPDRTIATVRTWLAGIPIAIRRQIRTVCTDIWIAYVSAVQEVLPHVAIVIDRFHVATHYRDAVDTLRYRTSPACVRGFCPDRKKKKPGARMAPGFFF